MIYYNEWDKKTAAWLRELIKQGHLPDGHVDERSIADVQPADLDGYTQCHFFAGIGGWAYAVNLAGYHEPCWTASMPCQPWSASGRKLGASDERHLLPVFASLVERCRPGRIFGEQAPNLEWLDAASDAMEAIDYSIWSQIRRADAAGFFQERRRLYWAAADTTCQRQQEQRNNKQNTINIEASRDREADRLVSAFRRKTLPFLCSEHDGVSGNVGKLCCTGFGNAIVPQVAAEFILAAEAAIEGVTT